MDEDEEPWHHHHQHFPNAHCWPRPHFTPRYHRFFTTSHLITNSSSSSSSSKDHPFPFWTLLWRWLKNNTKNSSSSSKKIKNRGSMMMLQCCYCCDSTDSVSMNFGYDSISYLQNFDQGGHFNDRDDLSRSFSARFAVPTSVFDDKN